MKYTMGLFLLVLASTISLVTADIGFVSMRNKVDDTTVEVCSEFNPHFAPYPETIDSSTLGAQVLDIYPSSGCDPPENPENYRGKIVIVKRHDNCTFFERANLIQKAQGKGVIVVSGTATITPGVSNISEYKKINITVSLITEQSHNSLSDAIEKYGEDNVFIQFHAPPDSGYWKIDSLIMWVLAIVTCGIGAWSQATLFAKESAHKKAMKENTALNGRADKNDKPISLIYVFVFFGMCSVSILLMYFFYQYMVYVIIVIFCIASCFATYDFFTELFVQSPCVTRYRLPKNNVPLLKSRPPVIHVVVFLCCAFIAVFWAVKRKESYAWVLQDFLGFMFCINMIKNIRLSNFKITSVLLILFFVYDIFYVFVTPLLTKNKESIMVAVATGGGKSDEQIPMLFKLPRIGYSPYHNCGPSSYSLLGYGDIVLPGLHIGFCAVWDYCISNTVRRHPYYIGGMVGYSIGLIATYVGMYLMQSGQPALLYLTPSCLISTLIVALKRRELGAIWRGEMPKKERSYLGSAVDQNERDSFLREQEIP